jgi:hypothetical protein
VQSSPQERYIRDVVAGVKKAGDTEAYDEIVSLFRDEIYAIAWRLTRCADDAQDILYKKFSCEHIEPFQVIVGILRSGHGSIA